MPGDSALAGQAARALRSSDGGRGHPGMLTHMDEGTIKTQNPKCRLYWCLIEFIDWRYSQSSWYFRPLL